MLSFLFHLFLLFDVRLTDGNHVQVGQDEEQEDGEREEVK